MVTSDFNWNYHLKFQLDKSTLGDFMRESKILKQIIGTSIACCLSLKVAITCKVDAWIWFLFFKNHIINNKNGTIARVVRAIKALDCEFWGLFKNKVTRTTKKMKRNCTNTRVNTQTKGKKFNKLQPSTTNWCSKLKSHTTIQFICNQSSNKYKP